LTFTVNNPLPALSGLSQTSVLVGSGGLTLTVNGSGFVSGSSVVRWNAGDRTTTFVSSGQLQAQLPASDFSAAGTFAVTVFNPAPGGGSSGALTFTVNNPLPAISSLLPSGAFAGGSGFSLTVYGSNFVNGARVLWNGAARPTTFVNSGQLTAQIGSLDIAASGAPLVIVQNPSPGGGNSISKVFSVTNTTPLLFSTYPDAVPAQAWGGHAFSLTLNGAYFVAGSTAYWNGSARPTTYVNSGQLIVAIGGSDLASAGNFPLTVSNPTPGGGTSAQRNFTVSAACLDRVVTSLGDTATCGTLRNAVTKASNVYLALDTSGGPPVITLGSPAFTIPAGVAVYGVCRPDGAAVRLAGAATGGSLTLGGGNVLFGLKLVGFGGSGKPQLKVLSGGGGAAKLSCTSVSKQ
jgi:hypothetical protein